MSDFDESKIERDEQGRFSGDGSSIKSWAGDKSAKLSRVKGVPVKVKLPEAPHRYFKVAADTSLVNVSKIVPIRARREGIENAESLMASAEKRGAKRDPISLEDQGDGTFKVLDGNSTFAIAQKHGWGKIPARIWAKGTWVDPKGKH